MRQAKFRGMNEHGHMITGFLSMNCEFNYVISEPFEFSPTMNDPCGGVDMHYYVVDEKTIGEFTGLTDKNVVDIYEGDIIEFKKESRVDCVVVKYSKEYGFEPVQIPCDFDEIMPCMDDVELIGNIHQNPELMEQN